MFRVIETTSAAVVAVDAIGRIEDADYKDSLIPRIENALRNHDKLRLLIRFGPEFEGYSAHAAFDDSVVGIKHWHDFERLAVVTDVKWIANGVRLFAPIMPGRVRVFSNSQFDDGLKWVIGESADSTQ